MEGLLDKQIQIYSVDTGNFYSNREARLHWKNHEVRVERNNLIDKRKKLEKEFEEKGIYQEELKLITKEEKDVKEYEEDIQERLIEYKRINSLIKRKTDLAKQTKEDLLKLLSNKVEENKKSNGKHHIRNLRENEISQSRIISIFESALTRTIGAEIDALSEDLMVLQVFYFSVLEDLIHFGYYYKGEKYIYFTSSAGQIRTKKCVFIKESVYRKYEKTFMCGLTIERINELGGNNPTKHLAYTALINSATDEWKCFDIDRVIVVDDFETKVFGTVDFINDENFEITRKEDWIPIPHTDGCGMILPNAFDEHQVNVMVRLPWVKGLLGVFDYMKFIQDKNCSSVVEDIYGISHDLVRENIQIILTKSQFKMWKYYPDWTAYKEAFKKYNCQACITNPEEERIKDATINYQMLQSLTDITDEEILQIVKPSSDILKYLCSSVENIQECFGATPYNHDKTPFQEAILLYPELLNDVYVRNKLREMKDRIVKRYKSGKIRVRGKYTFVLPDLYAFCEWLFLHEEVPKGLLDNGEVFCWMFKKDEKLDCLRSPHLYREHPVRKNMAWNESPKQGELREWFTTNAIYTSTYDMISKYLMFDVDGDKLLVVADKTIIKVAERNMQNIVPLYYDMKKALPHSLTNENIYDGLIHAFTGGNIGIYSNNISKIWNDEVFITGTDEEKQRALDCIKCLVCQNNFVIDN